MRFDLEHTRFVEDLPGDTPRLHAVDGAIAVRDGVAVITRDDGPVYLTLANPVAGDNGMRLRISSRTAGPPHVVTIPSGFGGRPGLLATLIAFTYPGDAITLAAENGFWVPIAAPYGAAITEVPIG